ncbi:MAG: class I SAM-dependent methyltransferase [Gammaproteobacteria bacterium]|nr:class I SAM-dependent methyltransferase [Gammaproteobacteria bacterium]
MSKKYKHNGKGSMASRADRHDLYQRSVQCVEAECDMIDETFRKIRKRSAKLLREDFCGTANTSCEWVRRRKSNRAVGVDLDSEVMAWGQKHNIGKLKGSAAQRIQLIQDDVLKVRTEPVDVVLAMNFSYQLLQQRKVLRQYFSRVREALVNDGVFFLDAYGGYESYRVIKERTKHKGFTFIWDQAKFNPITHEMTCYIHFAFPDGSKMKRAFSYEWRMCTLPEIRELLVEAGFSKVTVYWEQTDEETGEGNGVYLPAEQGDPDPSWVCYLAAEK